MRRIALVALAALLAAVGLVACGGSGQPSAEDQAFIAAADAICKAASNKLYESGEIPEGASNAEAKEWIADTWVPVNREAHEKIAALSIPQDAGDKIGAYLTALEDTVIAAENDPSTRLTLDTPEDKNLEHLASDAGLEECRTMGE